MYIKAFLLCLFMCQICLVLSRGQFMINFPSYISCKPPGGLVCLQLRKCSEMFPLGSPYHYMMRDQQCGFHSCCNKTTTFPSSPQGIVDQYEEDPWNESNVFDRVFENPTKSLKSTSSDSIFRSCQTSIGERCVKLRRCPFFYTLVQNSPRPLPKAVHDIIKRHHCGMIESTPYVCCNTTTHNPIVKSITTGMTHDQVSMADVPANSWMFHTNYKMLPRNCGPVKTSLLSSRITNGENTDLNEFPWMVLIAYRVEEDVGDVTFKCAGTLINERFVLTAAHCILDSTILGVRLGEFNVNKTEDCDEKTLYCAPSPQDILIENLFVHPGYNKQGWKNDIALIKLAAPANFTDNVQPICLPSNDEDLTGKFATISGWGVTETGFQSPILRKAIVPVRKLSDCQKMFKRYPPTATQLCAGGRGGTDSCAGDSGGPLKVEEMSGDTVRFVQYGIVSYGRRQCDTNGVPSIYTRVSKYMNWILGKLDT